jgi:hypothetical protein
MGDSLPSNVVKKTTDTEFEYYELEAPSGDPARLDEAPMSLPDSAIALPHDTVAILQESCSGEGPTDCVARFVAREGENLTAQIRSFLDGSGWLIVEFSEDAGPYHLPYLLPEEDAREVLAEMLDSLFWRLAQPGDGVRDQVIDAIVE